ncbi:MAG TPA: S26 family signal peptidase [Candidatus Binataceae bacterium]|jgi:type IV secretory pathway protease TraF|nr:S26 family signal peptidase [Candidatus Binataceae bacterium]
MKTLARLGFVLVTPFMLFAVLGLACNNSPSAPRGLYRLTHSSLQRGTFVVLKMPLKRIAAMAGDTVQVTAEGSYINGKLWPGSAIPDDVLTGHRLEHYPFGTYTLRPGQLWVLSHNPFGWDSRYFGPVDQSLVNATAEPLLTTEE